MQHSFSLLINDERALACAVSVLGPLVEPLADCWPRHVGIGSYQDAEVLLHRRPLGKDGRLASILAGMRSPCVLAHVREPGPEVFRSESQAPLRFREWVFAFAGSLQPRADFDPRMLAIPSHIAANMLTHSPEEIVFHLFLAFLHGASRSQVSGRDVPVLRRAVEAALSYVETSFLPGPDASNYGYDLLLSNGELVIGVTHGRPLSVVRLDGLERCPRCSDLTVSRDRDARIAAHPHVRVTLVTDVPLGDSSVPGARTDVPDCSICFVDGDGPIRVFPLGEREAVEPCR